MRRPILKYLLLTLSVIGCSSSGVRSDEKSKSTASDEKESESVETDELTAGTDEPADINAMYLTLDCEQTSSDLETGKYEIGCNLKNKTGEAVAPSDVSTDHSWTVTGTDLGENFAVEVMPTNSRFAVVIKFGNTAYIDPAVFESAEVSFSYNDIISNTKKSVTSRLAGIFASLVDQKYFRLVIDSIGDHIPSQTIQFLDKIEIKVNGTWLELKINLTTYAILLGTSKVDSNGNANDALIFRNILGVNNPVLRPQAFDRFNPVAPFDNKSGALTLTFGSDRPSTVSGLRYNSGTKLVSKNFAAGFPDAFHFEVSPDKKTWKLVPGSKIEIDNADDSNIMEYVWKGVELKIPTP